MAEDEKGSHEGGIEAESAPAPGQVETASSPEQVQAAPPEQVQAAPPPVQAAPPEQVQAAPPEQVQAAPPEQVQAAPPPEPEAGPDSVEEVAPEPEEVVAPRASTRVMSHHPPPPPRVRSSAASTARPIQVTGDPKLARDLMTRQLFTVGPEDPIAKLEAHMVSLHFRHLPVVDGAKVVGLISHADLLQAASSVLSTSAAAENAIIGKLPASRIMQRDLVTARPDETLSAVAERLWATRAEAILVTEEDGTLVGILTERDFVRLAHHLLDSVKTTGG